MKDPNHAYNPIEKVWAEAQQRARQFRNNEKALSLAFDEPSALSKFVNFLTKADGNVEPEDLPRGFDITGFFNDYQKFGRDGGLTWDSFKERYQNFIPYIHRAFDLDLEGDEPDIEELFDDTELMGIVDKIEAGESIQDFAPERAGEAPVEEPEVHPAAQPAAQPAAEPEVEAAVSRRVCFPRRLLPLQRPLLPPDAAVRAGRASSD